MTLKPMIQLCYYRVAHINLLSAFVLSFVLHACGIAAPLLRFTYLYELKVQVGEGIAAWVKHHELLQRV